ncbi:MAG: tetraacyldisaccharide 4'-kinase [Bacteroidetes bacterium]|nr:tetraacyldisaccharide 4'-kinase [Bacteroidota bacterium]
MFLRWLLFPLGLLYGFIMWLRNWFYDVGVLKSTAFDIPVIGIGNLSTGGTGKTPMAEFVLELLIAKGYNPAFLSRGYGRKTNGFFYIAENSSATEVGDEPLQVANKFPKIIAAVCEDRVVGIRKILAENPKVNCVVLDDCYQHRSLKAGFYILLTTRLKPYYNDFVLPAGNLREFAFGKRRAGVIIMTKCGHLPQGSEKEKLIIKLAPSSQQKVFFTGLSYAAPKSFIGENALPSNLNSILFFSGIADSQSLREHIKPMAENIVELKFPDHYTYSENDIHKIIAAFKNLNGEKIILTTEKDFCRLIGTDEFELLKNETVFYLPVSPKFGDEEGQVFSQILLQHLSECGKKQKP